MRSAIVTGAAGFIGSTLCEALVQEGWRVIGVDSFTSHYGRAQKEANLRGLSANPRFDLIECLAADLPPTALQGSPSVFHLAGQPGVRESWATGFDGHVEHNVHQTQRLLERIATTGIDRLIYASSSSVYGEAAQFPTPESALPAPRSPYGVSKLAGELLVGVYAGRGVPGVSLRLFTVYGPRQRPDMAFHRVCEAVLGRSGPFEVLGDGLQVRDFTYVDDVIDAFLMAATAATISASPLNVAGGSNASLADAISLIEEISDHSVPRHFAPSAAGDVGRTGGNTSAIRRALGWQPKWSLATGLTEQLRWHRERGD